MYKHAKRGLLFKIKVNNTIHGPKWGGYYYLIKKKTSFLFTVRTFIKR